MRFGRVVGVIRGLLMRSIGERIQGAWKGRDVRMASRTFCTGKRFVYHCMKIRLGHSDGVSVYTGMVDFQSTLWTFREGN